MSVGRKPVLGGREALKVAIVQKAPRFLDKEASLDRAETYIMEAAAGGAELIVFSRSMARGLSVLDRRLGFVAARLGGRQSGIS